MDIINTARRHAELAIAESKRAIINAERALELIASLELRQSVDVVKIPELTDTGQSFDDFSALFKSEMQRLPDVSIPDVSNSNTLNNTRIGCLREGYVNVMSDDAGDERTTVNGLVIRRNKLKWLRKPKQIKSFEDYNKIVKKELSLFGLRRPMLHDGTPCDLIICVSDIAYKTYDGALIVHGNRYRIDDCPDTCMHGDDYQYIRPLYCTGSGNVVWLNIEVYSKTLFDINMMDITLSPVDLCTKYGLSGIPEENERAFNAIVDLYIHIKNGCSRQDFETSGKYYGILYKNGFNASLKFSQLSYKHNPFYNMLYKRDFPNKNHVGFKDPYFFVQDIEYDEFGRHIYNSDSVKEDREIGLYCLKLSKCIGRNLPYMPRIDGSE